MLANLLKKWWFVVLCLDLVCWNKKFSKILCPQDSIRNLFKKHQLLGPLSSDSNAIHPGWGPGICMFSRHCWFFWFSGSEPQPLLRDKLLTCYLEKPHKVEYYQTFWTVCQIQAVGMGVKLTFAEPLLWRPYGKCFVCVSFWSLIQQSYKRGHVSIPIL